MKKIFTLLMILAFTTGLMAEKPRAVIMRAEAPAAIDGEIDEMWDAIDQQNIDKPFQAETPTLGASGETYWKALWDPTGIYILVVVNDDVWVSGDVDWQYDKLEVYFDANFLKEDGGGASDDPGHYQVAPNHADMESLDGTPITWDNGIVWTYKLNGNAYTAEFFVPWTYLVDKDGIAFDKTSELGFDITVIDNDVEGSGVDGRNRAVWANEGAIDESWVTLDDAGLITFDGAEPGTYIDDIIVTPDGGTISKNKGTLHLEAEVIPEDATNQVLRWEVINKPGQTGMATVSNTGRVRGIADGEVTIRVSATDGSFVEKEVIVTLTNQMPTRWDFNHFRNGLLNEVNGTEAVGWGGWIDGTGTRTLVDGVYANDVTSVGMDGENIVAWRFQTAQEPVWRSTEMNVPYEFSFTAWAPNGARNIKANFEDPTGDRYTRYGFSNSDYTDGGPGGRSEWTFPLTTEPQRFVVDVTFDQILDDTFEKFLFGLSAETGMVMIDSILLIKESDLALAYPDDTYAMFGVTYSVAAGEGTLTATVNDEAVNSGDDVIYQEQIVFTAAPEGAYSVKEWKRDGVVIEGHTDLTYTTMVDDDMEITVEFIDATNVPLQEASKLRVYPNPFNNNIHIDNSEGFSSVSITNIVGQSLMSANIEGVMVIDTSDLTPGVYFMVFESEKGERLVRKVVKR